jgi:hypothetical protein
MSKVMLVGGPHGGKSIECVGPVLKMTKQIPLASVVHGKGLDEITTHCAEDRYILTTARSNNETYSLYVYEYEIHQDPIGLLIREIHKLNRKLQGETQ